MRIVFRCDPAIENELMRLVAARAALPDWLRAMPRTAFSELHGQEARTVKQCPPFVDAIGRFQSEHKPIEAPFARIA